MNLYQDCLDAMGIAMLELKAGSARLAEQTILSVVESLGCNSEVESQELRVLALYNLSQIYGYLKQPEEAQKRRAEAGAQLQQIESPGKVLDIEDRLADKLIELGEHRSAIPFCEQAIKLSEKDARKIANRLWRAARSYLRAGFKAQAEEPLRRALEIVRQQNADPRTPVVLIDLGNCLRRRSPREAESCDREAAAIWEREQKLAQASTAWVNLGVLCAEESRVTEALEWYERARKVREADPTMVPAKLGPLYNNIANVYRRMGDFDGADREARRAIALLESQGGASLAGAYGSLGLIFRDQGADEEPPEWFRKARAECEKQVDPDVTDLIEKLENEAATLRRLGRLTEAAAAENENGATAANHPA